MLNALLSMQDADPAGVERARTSLAVQGFVRTTTLRSGNCVVEGWSQTLDADSNSFVVDSRIGQACAVGPIWYRAAFGRTALELILSDHAAGIAVDEKELHGSFALFVQSAHGAILINDPLGLVKIHLSADTLFQSTSWLAVRAYSHHHRVNEAAAIEYVLLGAAHSNRSVAEGVSHLSLGRGFDVDRHRTFGRFEHGIAAGGHRFSNIDDAVESFAFHLHDVASEIAQAFSERVTCALSGGFDSRLIVASLLAYGSHPTLFVYGSSGSSDVRVASEVAASERLALDVIDKAVLERARREPDLADAVANALFFDGLPNDGVLDSGVDRETRLRQCADGAIALNGGGGEILRNFFHLPDRSFTSLDVVRAFYRGFDAGVFRRTSGLNDYEESLAASIDASISAAGLPSANRSGRYSREQIELVYPLFRCHHWMGVNNSVAVRYGQFATPLIDLTLVRDACLLPLRWKNAGRFEAKLISALHPSIASVPSAYGFSFDKGPGFRGIASEWATLCRPVSARPMISAARRALQGARVSRTLVERWRSMLPGEWRLDGVLDLERLPDRSSFSRALAIEIVTRELGR
jgi:asparagine synthase (glutamine-hydrolysing)